MADVMGDPVSICNCGVPLATVTDSENTTAMGMVWLVRYDPFDAVDVT